MFAKKILFPTDFSHAGDAALSHAATLARESDATLLIVHVEEPLPAYVGEGYYGLPNPPNPEVRRMLEAIKPPEDVKYAHVLLVGDPASEIVRLATEEKVDLIVLGTHGRTGLTRLLMGSVAEQIVRRAACPVLTFKQPKPVAAQSSG
jgi:nucleotide-binding universal stress UspA family protein